MKTTSRFRIKLALAIGLVATAAFATDRVMLNPESNGDFKIKANVAGTPADAIGIKGTTGLVSVGPLPTSGTMSPASRLYLNATSSTVNLLTMGNAAGSDGFSILYNPSTGNTAMSSNGVDPSTTPHLTVGLSGNITLGPANSTQAQTVNGTPLNVTVGTNTNSDGIINLIGGTSGRSELFFKQNGASPVTAAYVGASSGASGHIVGGDAAGDLAVVANSHAINFSGDNGNNNHASMSSGGRWLLGLSNRQTGIAVTQGQNASLFGNPSTQSITIANSGSAGMSISPASNGTALCLIENGNSAASALLFMGGAGNSIAIISQTGAVFTTGAPSSTQTQVTYTSSGSVFTITAGSANGTSSFITCMGTFI